MIQITKPIEHNISLKEKRNKNQQKMVFYILVSLARKVT